MSAAVSSPVITARPRPLLGAIAGAVVALVANTVVFLVANAIHGGPIQVSTDGTNPSDLQYVFVIVASLLPLMHIAAASAAIFGQQWAARRPSRKA
ncbi:MAG: hypothetical protein H7311_12195 [Ramlibacter sp.]|nr:hypothetical protein [Cryobacterium sp.]